MKNIIVFLVIVVITTLGISAVNAQNCCSKKHTCCNKAASTTNKMSVGQKTSGEQDTLFVNGACGMCKSRIEKTAMGIKGVIDAKWNATTNILTYSYTGTVNKMDVSNALLKEGHDTGYGKAPDDVYNKLPGCCKYRK